ncbi:MAG TPA: ClbS/DfsB family four-helix bundle protein, partial [Ktedonobacterales bacterium]|nr:ClbS/DfsB family four-helix bundle protein [Ktedonobacterales bacterium]
MPEALSREQLIQELMSAYEQLIVAATEADRRGVIRRGNTWGPREVVVHLAGWEIIAVGHISGVAAGKPSAFATAGEAWQHVMDDAINQALVTLAGEQSLDTLCDILRQAYQRDIERLMTLDDAIMQPGAYAYERTMGDIDHCREHTKALQAGEQIDR